MAFSRRDLLSRGALLVASGVLAPAFVSRTALALDNPANLLDAPQATPAPSPAPATTDPSKQKNILVVVQLSGGNDGLDTVIPFSDPVYPTIRDNLTDPKNVLKINDTVGLNPGLSKIKALYDQGKVAIVQGVGYPNPNRSHFRSMDIWHSAHPESMERSGWLGRYVAAMQNSQNNVLGAVSIGDQLNTMFWTDTTLVPSVASIGAFSFLTDTAYKNDRTFQLQTLQNIYNQAGAWPQYESLIRSGTTEALSAADSLQKVAASYKSTVQYPKNNGLASQLQLVAQIINGNLGARLFSVSMGGFDTHANEKNVHDKLFPQLGDALDAFMQDLAGIGQQDNVAILAFTEFGRRVKPNASGGTDHGTANSVFLIGNKVQGGMYGTYPSLTDLDSNADLKFNVDFRSVYASVLQSHVGTDPGPILAGNFPQLPLIKSA